MINRDARLRYASRIRTFMLDAIAAMILFFGVCCLFVIGLLFVIEYASRVASGKKLIEGLLSHAREQVVVFTSRLVWAKQGSHHGNSSGITGGGQNFGKICHACYRIDLPFLASLLPCVGLNVRRVS